jgi:chromosome segregation ATPase
MGIENIMYFALGLLAAGLLALIIMPAVWRRAVRLTKRRIEAATPITMAEFRADKDQLRAEFALSTRKLEMTIDALRKRMADQIADVDRKRADLGALKAERDQHGAVVSELEAREAEIRARLAELERDNTDLAQRLRMRERELSVRNEELETMRGGFDAKKAANADSLIAAEARLASAENRLNAILAETGEAVEKAGGQASQLLADKLSLDDELEAVRIKVAGVETTLLADWDTDRMDEAKLRDRLNDIAASVSRLVYASESEQPVVAGPEESLFDRVQRFAADGKTTDELPKPPPPGKRKGGSVTDRMAALREIQGR